MNDLTIQSNLATIVEDTAEGFFEPVSISKIESLLLNYQYRREKIEKFAAMLEEEGVYATAAYFTEPVSRDYSTIRLNSLAEAVSKLNSEYWGLALKATDVYDHMPQKRRDEWNESIKECTTPDFEQETVIATLKQLLLSRDKFLSERVDGIFRNLSGEHVTNAPEGFGKRMIMLYAVSYGSIDSSRAGYVNDLRCVIAKFMGRDMLSWNDSYQVLEVCRRNYGQWHEIDGGALKVKVFKKGTAHIEVHPDIAWRLNQILAILHPLAIPAAFRKRPVKRYKKFDFTQSLIPMSVLQLIGSMEQAYNLGGEDWQRNRPHNLIPNTYHPRYCHDTDKHVVEKLHDVLTACGGVCVHKSLKYYEFEYDFPAIKEHLITTGLVPDQKAHQYYQTPKKVARAAVEWCDIEDHHRCLEPSAGQGNLVAHMTPFATCVEVSELHCKILKEKGAVNVANADFIEWAKTADLVDRIVMNPPFSQGRAEQHLNTAAVLLREGGKLVAVLPNKKYKELPGFEYEYGAVYKKAFTGVSIDVVLLKLTRKQYA